MTISMAMGYRSDHPTKEEARAALVEAAKNAVGGGDTWLVATSGRFGKSLRIAPHADQARHTGQR